MCGIRWFCHAARVSRLGIRIFGIKDKKVKKMAMIYCKALSFIHYIFSILIQKAKKSCYCWLYVTAVFGQPKGLS